MGVATVAADDPGATAAVPRTHLVDRLLGPVDVVLVEAGGGYGKSVLLQQAAAEVDGRVVAVRLPRRDAVDVDELVARVAEAARPDDEPGPPVRGIGDLVRLARADGAVLVTVDNAQSLTDGAAAWLAELGEVASPALRLVVAGRALPLPLSALEVAGVTARLDTDALRLEPTETRALVRQALGKLDADRVWSALHDATSGWVALLVLTLRRLARSGDRAASVAELLRRSTLVGQLLDLYTSVLSPADRAALAQLAHFTAVTERVADAVGPPGVLRRLADAGIPLSLRPDGSWRLTGIVAEHLATTTPLDRDVARRAAPLLLADGAALPAARLLVDSGEPRAAAGFLAGLPATTVDALDPWATIRLVARLGDTVESEPRVLLHLARAHGNVGQLAEERAATDRALRAVRRGGADAGLAVEVEAEHLFQRAFVDDPAAHLPRVEELLAVAGPGTAARARLLEALGVALSDRDDEASLRRAGEALAQAAAVWDGLGEAGRAASARRGLAMRVLPLLGAFEDASLLLDSVAAAVRGRAYDRMLCLVFQARVLALGGDPERAEAVLAEAVPLAEVLGIDWVAGHAAWTRLLLAADAGDARATLRQLRAAEAGLGQLVADAGGVPFLCEAADACAKVGAWADATRLLDSARRRRSEDAGAVAVTEAFAAARAGDLAADEQWERLDDDLVPPGRRWHVQLLRAFAASRAGRFREARTGLQDALDTAARLGDPGLPERRERAVVEALRDAASAAPTEDDGAGERRREGVYEIEVLGTFQVLRDGKPLTALTGRATDLVKRLALAGGTALVDTVVEAAWPDEAPGVGQRRFKNVLSRTRRAYGPIVVRAGNQVRLAEGTVVDLARFEADAARVATATGPERVALARHALRLYTGPVLPGDLYDDWVSQRREAVRRRALGLADLVLAADLAAGDLDDALTVLDTATEHDPVDHERPIRVAKALVEAGRDLEARSILAQVKAVADEVDLPLPAAWWDLMAAVATD